MPIYLTTLPMMMISSVNERLVMCGRNELNRNKTLLTLTLTVFQNRLDSIPAQNKLTMLVTCLRAPEASMEVSYSLIIIVVIIMDSEIPIINPALGKFLLSHQQKRQGVLLRIQTF